MNIRLFSTLPYASLPAVPLTSDVVFRPNSTELQGNHADFDSFSAIRPVHRHGSFAAINTSGEISRYPWNRENTVLETLSG
jgi:hypothetical protein